MEADFGADVDVPLEEALALVRQLVAQGSDFLLISIVLQDYRVDFKLRKFS